MFPDLDEAYLSDSSDGDAEFAQELLDIFMASLEVSMRNLREAVVSGDLVKIERAAHYTRGGASSIGAVRLAEANGSIERAAKLADRDSLQHLRIEVDDAYERLKYIVGERQRI